MLIRSLEGGGAERVASELSLNLSKNIHRKLVTLRSGVSYPTNEPPLSMNLNFKKRNIKDRLIEFLFFIILGSIKYRKISNEYKPDVSLSFLTFDNFVNIISNIGNEKTKVIVSVHIALSMKTSVLDYFASLLMKILYNKADIIIAVSEGVRNELIQDYKIAPEKVRKIYNPVDIENIQKLANEEVKDEWFDGEQPILINMGRLMEQKGQWHLIRAFSKVKERKQCKLVIRGSGDLKPYLEKLVRDLDLTNDVKFLGWLDNPFKYLSKSSIFVLSSIYEALPYALIEAMACGCPIISTDCKYGPSEILEKGKFGILTPPMDGKFYKASDPLTPEEHYLANQIIRLLENDVLRMKYSEKARKRANDFDKKTLKEYENIILKLTASTP